MNKILVIVESPGKIKKIGEYLGNDYIVKASFGHCRDLDPKNLSIDVNNNYKPNYIIIDGKSKVIRDLKYFTKNAKEVILAADEDREGEMIASSLRDILKLKNPKRIVFHEITKKAINEAVKNPTLINENMVFAQQTRRLLDRLVGYKISPLLWKKIKGQLSAGRVQSVVVKIVIDKENTINESISNPYFKTVGTFIIKKTKLNTVLTKGKKIHKIKTKDKVIKFLNKFNKKSEYKVIDVSNNIVLRKPPPPFITSSLQQDASSKLGYNSKYTMGIAQKLYEAGLITYMRTDSTNLSKEALAGCKKYIVNTFGEEYWKYRTYSKKSKNAQEAHEAIRPTKMSVVNSKLSSEYQKLYSLIWKRTLASQMADTKVNVQTISIDVLNTKKNKSILPSNSLFVTKLEKIIFDGFLVIYNRNNKKDETIETNINDSILFDSIKVTEEYTKPPLRYNEAGLIKYLEKNGIGRPSTYASIMSKIIDRNYVQIKNIDGVKK